MEKPLAFKYSCWSLEESYSWNLGAHGRISLFSVLYKRSDLRAKIFFHMICLLLPDLRLQVLWKGIGIFLPIEFFLPVLFCLFHQLRL